MSYQVIVTAVGKNRPGVLAEITTTIAKAKGNVQDISQKMMQEYFNLIMIVELANGQKEFAGFKLRLEELGKKKGYQINVQHEKIFRYMHRV